MSRSCYVPRRETRQILHKRLVRTRIISVVVVMSYELFCKKNVTITVLMVFNKLFLAFLFAEKTFDKTDEIPIGPYIY